MVPDATVSSKISSRRTKAIPAKANGISSNILMLEYCKHLELPRARLKPYLHSPHKRPDLFVCQYRWEWHWYDLIHSNQMDNVGGESTLQSGCHILPRNLCCALVSFQLYYIWWCTSEALAHTSSQIPSHGFNLNPWGQSRN